MSHYKEMTASELVAELQRRVELYGDHPVCILDSHANTLNGLKVEFIKYAHPVIMIYGDNILSDPWPGQD